MVITFLSSFAGDIDDKVCHISMLTFMNEEHLFLYIFYIYIPVDPLYPWKNLHSCVIDQSIMICGVKIINQYLHVYMNEYWILSIYEKVFFFPFNPLNLLGHIEVATSQVAVLI